MCATASAVVTTDAGVISICSALGSSSQIVSRTPIGSSTALTDRPVMPAPVTNTRAPAASGARSVTSCPDGGQPLAVEQRHAEAAGDGGEQPEANDDRRFSPADEFEVVVKRRHPKHSAPGGPERHDLHDHRCDLGDEQGTEHHCEHLGA